MTKKRSNSQNARCRNGPAPQGGRTNRNMIPSVPTLPKTEHHETAAPNSSWSLKKIWSKWWGKVIAFLSALALIFGLLDQAFGWKLVDAWNHRQPQADQKVLSELRVGEIFGSFEGKFERGPSLKTVIGNHTRYVFVLDNAYVEAFVDSSDNVAAYGIIMKGGAHSSPIRLPMRTVIIGVTTLDEAMRDVSPLKIGGACGAHHQHYYEISTLPPGAFNYQNLAVGVTSASTHPPSTHVSAAVGSDPAFQVAWSEPPVGNPQFTTVTDWNSFAQMKEIRENTIIDSVFLSAPGVEITDAMLLLHDAELTPIDPWKSNP